MKKLSTVTNVFYRSCVSGSGGTGGRVERGVQWAEDRQPRPREEVLRDRAREGELESAI